MAENETSQVPLDQPATLNEVVPAAQKPTERPKHPVSDEDKERFFKSFLGDAAYHETMALFNGKVKVEFRTLDVKENYEIFNQVDLDRKSGKAKNEDSYLMEIVQYRLAVSLVSINGKPFAPELTREAYTPSDANVSYVSARAAELKTWPVHKLAGVIGKFNEFEEKVQQLTGEISNTDFWKAGV